MRIERKTEKEERIQKSLCNRERSQTAFLYADLERVKGLIQEA